MQQPIIVEPKEAFKKKEGLSDIEIRGIISYINEYIEDYYGYDPDMEDTMPADMENYFQIAYSDSQLNCCGEAPLPGAPDELENVPVSHFYLTPNHCLMAVFFVGDEEKEVLVRIN